jgi:hypothetical protein
VAFLEGNVAEAEVLYAEARQVLQNLGADRDAAEACYGLACSALAQKDESRAASLFGTSLALAHGVEDKMKIADNLEGVADVAVRLGQAEQAASLLGAAAALRDRISGPIPAHRRDDHARIVAAARAGLAAERYAAAWQTGQSWSLAEAVGEARSHAEAMAEQTDRI